MLDTIIVLGLRSAWIESARRDALVFVRDTHDRPINKLYFSKYYLTQSTGIHSNARCNASDCQSSVIPDGIHGLRPHLPNIFVQFELDVGILRLAIPLYILNFCWLSRSRRYYIASSIRRTSSITTRCVRNLRFSQQV